MKPIVIYDGACQICTGNLIWLRRLDWLQCFDAIPYQDPMLYQRFPALSPSACEKALHVVFSNEKFYAGADAVREILLRLPLMAPLGFLFALPPLRQALRPLYALIARNRYCISGTCAYHKKEARHDTQ